MGRSRFRFGESPFPHFLTCTIVGWLPVFTRPETVQIVLDSWRFVQDEGRTTLLGYVVLENHVHFIASAEDLATQVGDFKSYTARRVIDHLTERRVWVLLEGLGYHKARHKGDRPYQLWQEGSHPKVIETDAMLRQKLEYIHQNPVKRGYVSDATHWRYSSARNYAKVEALTPVTIDWRPATGDDAERRGRHPHAERGNEGKPQSPVWTALPESAVLGGTKHERMH